MSVAWPAVGWDPGLLLGQWRRFQGPRCCLLYILGPLAACARSRIRNTPFLRPTLSLADQPWTGVPLAASAPQQLSGEGGVNLSQASLSLNRTLTGTAGKGLYRTGKRRVETRVLSCLLPHCLFWAWVSKVERALVCKATSCPLCLRWFRGRIKSVASSFVDRPGGKTPEANWPSAFASPRVPWHLCPLCASHLRGGSGPNRWATRTVHAPCSCPRDFKGNQCCFLPPQGSGHRLGPGGYFPKSLSCILWLCACFLPACPVAVVICSVCLEPPGL